jgi:hypothetical protein
MDRFKRKLLMDRKIVQSLIEGQSFNKISKLLKVSKNRIKKVNELAKEMGYLDGKALPAYPEVIFNYTKSKEIEPVSAIDNELLNHLEWIEDRRKTGWHLIIPIPENNLHF